MRTPANPFILSGYHSPVYFCNRSIELDWLFEQFENERNVVLYSWRRMGKTALIRHFFHHLEEKKKGQGVFIDLLGTTNLSEANRRIAGAIIEKFGTPEKGLGARLMRLLGVLGAKIGLDPMTGVPEVSIGLQQQEQVAHSLEAISEYLSEMKINVVICIDEFQQVVNYTDKNAESTFRTWMQSYPMIRFIYCGSHRQMMVSMFSEESRPFYRSAQLKQLETLDEQAYLDFINHFFIQNKQGFPEEAVQKVFEWSRMQTYYVQLVCNKLFGRGRSVDSESLQEVFKEIIQQEVPIFSSMQQLFTGFQWKLLKAIALDEKVANPVSSGFLVRHELGAASSVSTALNTLVRKEFVVRENNQYMLQDTLFMRYIQQLD